MGSFGQVSLLAPPSYISTNLSCVLKFFGGISFGVAELVFASELSKFLLKYAPAAFIKIVLTDLRGSILRRQSDPT